MNAADYELLAIWNRLSDVEFAMVVAQGGVGCVPRFVHRRQERIKRALEHNAGIKSELTKQNSREAMMIEYRNGKQTATTPGNRKGAA